ncbi:phosphoserine phosphatase SerB [Paradevosia shaoguanensis]|uniref:Phosphoserine phosphatase n=1 Tax=Paradevosia shaoguanensis TaxID=1335043 RepID=A0AA41QP45_9HYPH|nr:phosphoserine phosphatase SerB [Paradevosia shaoguanensis]MCF1743289.1 phosphoserine phosphatase SerB [Paradevosia shaoguanensis]MCI0127772.1 phosphoserine phosphatase SerB [Paradevosia shaoguanensis]
MSVLCLIANPADPALDSALVTAVQKETGGEVNWLTQRIACEIIAPKSTDPLATARLHIKDRAIDAALVPSENRRKKLLIADMDSTMIEQECIDELADALGIKDEVADITARAMNGELDFEQALDTRVALLKGLERAVIEEIRRERITLAPGGRALVHTMKAYGAYTALISGGFTFFADYIAKRIGFDEATANVLEFADDKLTGTVTKPIVDKTTKLARLNALAAEHGLSQANTLAVGDGANDLDMIRASGLGVALHAKPVVAEQAHVRIDHGDLTALLYLQGYSDEDFVR